MRAVIDRVLDQGPIPSRQYLVASIAATTMMLLLASCSSASNGTSAGAASSGTAQSAGTDTTSSQVTDYVAYTKGKAGAADSSKSPVTIGWVNQQGGSLAFPTATAGAQAAVKYVNSKLGGIDGHPLKLSTCFVAANESEGTSCGQQFVNDSAVRAILYGTLLSGDQSLQAVNNGQKPILMGNAIGPSDAKGKNVYIYNGTTTSTFGGIATYLVQVLHAKSVALLYPNNAQTIGGVQSLEAALKPSGVKVKAVGYDQSATDLTAPAVASGAQTADAVVQLSSTAPLCIATAKALDSLHVKAPVVTAGSFCFSPDVATGLGGKLPHWVQDSVQSNVADTSQPDVKAYLAASRAAGLSAAAQSTANASLGWALVMTAARFLNEAGGASATSGTIAQAAKAFKGPMLLGSPELKCGGYASAPSLCGAYSREFQYVGNSKFKAVTGWLKPTGM